MIAGQLDGGGGAPGGVDRHGERCLQAGQRADDLAPDAHHGQLGELAGMAAQQAAQDLRFAAGAQRHPPVALGGGDPSHQAGTAHQQVVQLIVDAINFTTELLEGGAVLVHGGKGGRNW